MATAIVSDLHLGLRDGRDLLRHPEVQDALEAVLADADALVLLGDVVELRERPIARALADARPALERIGRAMAGKPVTIVPGNHDHHLAAPLLDSRGAGNGELAVDSASPLPSSGPLAEVAAALGDAEVRLAYPGVWVRPDVFATHGHYLDVHNTVPTFERLAVGVVQRVTRGLPEGPLTPADYEAALAPVYALTYALAQSARAGGAAPGGQASVRMWRMANGHGGRLPALLVGRLALPAAIRALNLAGLGPLRPDLSAVELRRAGLRGIAEVVRRLGVDADHVIFGHTHRSGPHEGDDPHEWRVAGGGSLINTGSWIHEPAFLGSSPRTSPYWPGHAAIVPDSGPPRLARLVDDLPFRADALRN